MLSFSSGGQNKALKPVLRILIPFLQSQAGSQKENLIARNIFTDESCWGADILG